MFLQNLNFEQQRAFLKLADEIIKADGILSQQEDKLYAELKLQLPSNIEAANSLDNLKDIFKSKKAKYSVLTELIGISFIDDDFDQKEKNYIFELGQKLKLKKTEINYLIDWVEKQFSLIKEINNKMGE